MLVIPYMAENKSKGGIALTTQTMERENLATTVCAVLKMGPLCFNDVEKYGPDPWCKVGDWVLIGRYAGSRFKLEDGEEVRIINDDEINATILEPTDIRTYL
jgi:co-chaperonin GroES (HSP10)